MITVGVAGVGAWGKNLVRAFASHGGANLEWLCDLDEARLGDMAMRYPGVRTTTDFEAMVTNPEVQAVVIATSAPTHARLARLALDAGKDVFVEKPLALSVEDAQDLVDRAEAGGRILMVGHLLVHHPAVEYLADLVERGELGDIHYLYSMRVNLGRIRSEENALWSFAPHDLSIVDVLLGQEQPRTVACRGASYLQPGIEDVVFLNLEYPSKVMVQVQLSWLDPHKVRRLTVVGSRKMVVFDDVHPSDKIWIYDKGVDRPSEFDSFGEYLSIRHGDTLIPRIPMKEPLACEVSHFLERVADRAEPASSGRQGLRIVSILAAAQQSLEQGGHPVELGGA